MAFCLAVMKENLCSNLTDPVEDSEDEFIDALEQQVDGSPSIR